MKFRYAVFFIAIYSSTRAFALDPAVCNAAAAKIDERIAEGGHPQQNVELATQMRDGILQSCAFLDEATLAGITQGINQVLPGGGGGAAVPQKSAAEKNAEREAQRAEADQRQAERAKQREAKQARRDAELTLVSNVARKPPTGISVKGQTMSRADSMWRASIIDWDIYENRARLLYETRPSREQLGLADAARHHYVVEFDKNNSISQHHVVVTDITRTVSAALIRGQNEIILQWHEGGPSGGDPVESMLERWSITDGTMQSSAPAPKLNGPKGPLRAPHHFKLVTADGELLFAVTVPLETGATPKTGVSWMLATPGGEVLKHGLIAHEDESLSTGSWFASLNGGAGLILDVAAIDDKGISSQLKPDVLRVGDTDVHGRVFSERRIYVVGSEETGTSLPAIERRLMWMGLENLDQATMLSGDSMRLTSSAERKYRVNDSAVSLAVAGGYRTAVTAVGDGHAVLVENNDSSNDEFPPTNGIWLQEFAAGKPRRDTYLNPDAEYLNVLYKMLVPDGEGNLYVASSDFVMRLNDVRELVAYAASSSTTAVVKAMVADDANVWLFGEDTSGATQDQVWVERIQF